MSEVKGIGDEAPEGWVLEEYEAPMPPGLQSILEAVKGILQQGRVQSILLRLGHPITFTRMVKEAEAAQRRAVEEQGGMSLGEVARNVKMEEFAGSGSPENPAELLFEMALGIEVRHLHLTHIGVGAETRFFEWMGIDRVAYGGIENLMGARLVRDPDIPDDVMILFGGPRRMGRIDQITYAFKSHMSVASKYLEEEDREEQRFADQDHGGRGSSERGRVADGAMADHAVRLVSDGGGSGPGEGGESVDGP